MSSKSSTALKKALAYRVEEWTLQHVRDTVKQAADKARGSPAESACCQGGGPSHPPSHRGANRALAFVSSFTVSGRDC